MVRLLLIAALLAPQAALADVQVSYLNPEHFTDAQFEDGNQAASRLEVQNKLTKMFTELAAKYLPPAQSLTIEVTDVDLAGRFEPGTSNVRFMLPITWPRIQLNYTVTEEAAAVASGKVDLSDRDYLARINLYSSSDRLRYEHQMLADWFGRIRRSLAAQAASASR